MASPRDRKTLRQAATLLEEQAKLIHDSEVVLAEGHPMFGKIADQDAQKEHDELLGTARRLRALARR